MNYHLTQKGIDLARALLELLIRGGARHEPTGASREMIEDLAANRAAVLAETRRRWKERDPDLLLSLYARQANRKGKSKNG